MDDWVNIDNDVIFIKPRQKWIRSEYTPSHKCYVSCLIINVCSSGRRSTLDIEVRSYVHLKIGAWCIGMLVRVSYTAYHTPSSVPRIFITYIMIYTYMLLIAWVPRMTTPEHCYTVTDCFVTLCFCPKVSAAHIVVNKSILKQTFKTWHNETHDA